MKARENPFATSRVLRIRYRMPRLSWPQLLRRMEAVQYRGAIVGPHGSGKTTLLEDLAPHLTQRGFVLHTLRLDSGCRAFPRGYLADLFNRWGPRDCLLFDGAEQMSRWTWARCRRWAGRLGGFVITSHRPGLLPTVHQCQTSPALLAGIVGDLLGRPMSDLMGLAERLYERHRGNIRSALRDLYDQHA